MKAYFLISIIAVFGFFNNSFFSQLFSKMELNTSFSKEFYLNNQFSNNLYLDVDYKINEKNRMGIQTGLMLGLNDFLFLYLKELRTVHKVYPLYLKYTFVANKNQISFGLGTELLGYGSNNILSGTYWREIYPSQVQIYNFKIRDRMQLIVPCTYGYQFYKNLSATAGVTFYRTKCFEPDSYFDVTYFHHLTYSVGLKYRFKRKADD